MVAVFREVGRVLRDDGFMFVNLGDSFDAGGRQTNGTRDGYKQGTNAGTDGNMRSNGGVGAGQQLLMPHRVALALQADGWILRDTVIWAKRSPMPSSQNGVRWCRHKVKYDYDEAVSALQRVETGEWIFSEQEKQRWVADVLQAMYGGDRPYSQADSARSECGNGKAKGLPKQSRLQGVEEEIPSSPGGRKTSPREEACHGQDVPEIGERACCCCEAQGNSSRQDEESRDDTDGSGMEGNQAGTEGKMLLVQKACDTGNGSRHSGDKERRAHERKCGGGVPDVQREKGKQGSDAVLIPCPGCPKCIPNDGYVLRRGQGRTTTAHEYLFLFTKTNSYFWDMENAREPAVYAHVGIETRPAGKMTPGFASVGSGREPSGNMKPGSTWTGTGFRIPRSVWTLSSEPTKFNHFATYPSELVRRCLMPLSPRGCCPVCGAQWAPVVEQVTEPAQVYGDRDRECFPGRTGNGVQKRASEVPATSKVIGYRPTCSCNAEDPAPCRVLDPFSGTGTTGQTACFLGHDYVGIELNPDYAAHSDKWINMEPRWSKRKNLVASTRKNTMSQANQLSLFS